MFTFFSHWYWIKNDPSRLKVKGWKKIHHVNTKHKKYAMEIYREKNDTWNKMNQFIIIKWSIYQEDITMLNFYVLVTKLQNAWSKDWYNCKKK